MHSTNILLSVTASYKQHPLHQQTSQLISFQSHGATLQNVEKFKGVNTYTRYCINTAGKKKKFNPRYLYSRKHVQVILGSSESQWCNAGAKVIHWQGVRWTCSCYPFDTHCSSPKLAFSVVLCSCDSPYLQNWCSERCCKKKKNWTLEVVWFTSISWQDFAMKC